MLVDLEATLTLEHIAAIDEDAPVEAQSIGDTRYGGAAVSQRPVTGMKLMHPSPGVAAHVGRIVPCAVEHDAPSGELRTRVVRILVVVEEVGQRETSGGDGVTRHRTGAAELVLVAFDGFSCISETEVMCDVESGQVRL